MAIFQDDRGFPVHLCELPCDESDDPMFEIICIIDEDRFRGIDRSESFFEVVIGRSLSRFIHMFELFEEAI